MLRIPRPNRFRYVLELEYREVGLVVGRSIVCVKSVESRGDLARSDKVIPRRTGFDDFLDFFTGATGSMEFERLRVDGVPGSFLRSRRECSVFDESSVFEDIISCFVEG